MSLPAIPFAILVSFFWGIQPIIHKILLTKLDPRIILVIGSVFYTLCLICFTIFNWSDLKREANKLNIRTVFIIGILSVITAFVANLIYLYILKKQESYIISALIYSCPIFTLILSYIFLKEKITPIGGVGVILIILGVICIVFNESHEKFERFLTFKLDL